MDFRRVINDTFDFCWTAVCAVDPDYIQYCVDSDGKIVVEVDQAAVQEAITPLQQLVAAYRADLVPVRQVPQPAAIGLQPENDDLPVDPTALIDPKLKEREYYDWATHTTKYYTDDEYAVLCEMSGGNVRGTSRAVGNINPANMEIHDDGFDYHMTPLTPEELAERQAKIDAEIADLRKWSRALRLKSEIEERNRFAGNPNVLALMPPKTILAAGSHVWQDDRSAYVAHDRDRELRKFVEFSRYSVRVSEKDGNLRYCMDKFIGGREKGFIRQVKGQQHRVIYNVSRKCLYILTISKDRRDKVKDIRCANFMDTPTVGWTGDVQGPLHNLFIKELLEIVRKDVPDVVLWNDGQPESASFIVFQHRYNKSTPWIDRDMWHKICEGIRLKPFVIPTEDNLDAWQRAIPNPKESARGMRIFHKIFRQFTNYTGLVKALFQEGYKKSHLELFAKVELNLLHSINLNMRRNGCSQTLYNFMLEILKEDSSVEFHRGGRDRFQVAIGRNHHAMQFTEVTEDTKKYPHIVDLWIKLCRRFIAESGVGMDWHMFRDTMKMSEHYHLRVRLNKFTSPDDVRKLHDKLQGYRNRDMDSLIWYRGTTIQPFANPDKEYDGYRFVFLDTPQAIVDEGTNMHHCCGNYTDQCIRGQSILFSMRKDGRGYVTIEINGETMNLSQKHTLGNNNVINERVDRIIERWYKDLIDMHEYDEKSYHQIAKEFNDVEKETLQKQHEINREGELANQMDELVDYVAA